MQFIVLYKGLSWSTFSYFLLLQKTYNLIYYIWKLQKYFIIIFCVASYNFYYFQFPYDRTPAQEAYEHDSLDRDPNPMMFVFLYWCYWTNFPTNLNLWAATILYKIKIAKYISPLYQRLKALSIVDHNHQFQELVSPLKLSKCFLAV